MTSAFPTKILVVSGATEGSVISRTIQEICTDIKKHGSTPLFCKSWKDAFNELKQTIEIAAVLIDWDDEYVKCKEHMRKYVISKGEQINDSKVLVLPSDKEDPFCGDSHPLMKLENDGFNLIVPKNYSHDKIQEIVDCETYEGLLKIIENNNLKVTPSPLYLIRNIKAINRKILIFLYTEKLVVERLPVQILESIKAYFWKNEETTNFVAKRIVTSSADYINEILPPFFKALVEYVHKGKYSYHCPGHMSGVAFLRSPAGKFFFDFFGENMLAADLCNAVGELGSLLNHYGPIGDAEKYASKVFGSDYTYFVTNGTSTANKIVFQATAIAGDVIILDRNAHKSSMQAIQLGNYRPIYLMPVRNKYGIIGPIPLSQFKIDNLIEKTKSIPYLKNFNYKDVLRLLVLTQCTYDGICYNVAKIIKILQTLDVKNMLFDEAWFPYAHFHPFYKSFHSMNKNFGSGKYEDDTFFHGHALLNDIVDDSDDENEIDDLSKSINSINPSPSPALVTDYKGTIFATQSSHKVLAALSQGSMIHIRNNKDPFVFERVNTYYQSNTSTSPLYPIIASLDMSSAIMDMNGYDIIDDVLKEAISFRCAMKRIYDEYKQDGRGWWFKVFQPDDILARKDIYQSSYWVLPPSSEKSWHGFPNIEDRQYLLDPLKVNIITIDEESGVSIPANVVGKYLAMNGIIMEKLGFFTMLSLFTIGSLRGKSTTLITQLTQFKRLYDNNVPMKIVFNDENIASGNMGLKDFCNSMNPEIQELEEIETKIYSDTLPDIYCIPYDASCQLVVNNVDWVDVADLKGRVSSILINIYPPGIPMIMPGEYIGEIHQKIIYKLAHFEERWEGFSFEIHGLVIKNGSYYIPCLKV